jgi:excisionase family DNA binding protein
MTNKPVLRLLPPQRVADAEQIAPLAYRLGDAARLLSCSKRTVERLCNKGELEAIGRGKLRRVLYDSIVAYLNRQRDEAA